MFARRAWKSPKLLHELTSSHSPHPDAHSGEVSGWLCLMA